MFLLPPRGARFAVVLCPEQAALTSQVIEYFTNAEYVPAVLVVAETSWQHLIGTTLLEAGPSCRRLWRPNAFLAEKLASCSGGAGSGRPLALEIACGSGRDAVFMALHGWRLQCVDRDAHLLGKVRKLATLEAVAEHINTLDLDLEASEDSCMAALQPLLGGVQLLHVARYLHRPLFPLLRSLVCPGGYVVYHTFLKGAERFGAPKRPRFLLQPAELSQEFGDQHGFQVLDYREATVEDGRPAAFVHAKKN